MSPLELPPDPELEQLAADLRAVRPEPAPTFLASLDARVAAGFAAGPTAPRLARWRRPQVLVPGVGAALAAGLVALVVALPGGDDGSSASRSTSAAAPESATPSGAASGTATAGDAARGSAPAPALKSAPSGAAPTPTPPGPVPAPAARRVERAVALTLTPAPADVQQTADGVVRETQAAGGYVQRSQVSVHDGGGTASLTLRLPSARLDDALARLSRLAHVGSLTQDATDVTASFTSATDRLADARAERRALLRALGRATSSRQVAALRARLADNRSEISRRKGELAAVRRRADLATVAVTVQGTGTADSGHGAWTPRDALRDAGRVLEVAGGVAVVALAVLAPLAALAALVALAARTGRRRRRDAALDHAI